MSWMNLLILGCLSVGHAELLVAGVNRLHAGRMPLRRLFRRLIQLKRLRHLHELLIPLFPVVLLFSVGLGEGGVLQGGRWRDLPLLWQVVLCFCAAGFAGFCWSVLRWWLKRVPAARLRLTSRVIDLEREMGYRPTGAGPRQILTKVPGNQLFQLEMTEQELCLPGLPAELDGLSIVHLTDLHFIGTIERAWFEEVLARAAELRPDLFLFTG
ncbi:MAG: hypothetical protein KDA79_13965, partial [Planctomycetaceae bacterium]|nr:hypothetical protein [Planctomycetaceae bacterium]